MGNLDTIEDDREAKLSGSPSVGEWLARSEQKIVPPWISAVQRASQMLDTIQPSGRKTRRMESVELLDFFDGVVTAVGEGSILQLDAALQSLVANRLGQGYSLADFLGMSDQLKSFVWHTAKESLASEKAIEYILAVEPTFMHSTSRMIWLANRASEAHREEELERLRRTVAVLDRTKSDFINIAAHELKTPLTIIRGYSSILASELSADPSFEAVLQGMSTGVGRLQVLIQDMIDVSLIDSNVLNLALEPASLYDIARLAIDDLRAEALDRNLRIVMSRFPSQVEVMYFDASRMYQVFTNIIGNAIKFTPDGGCIAIDVQILAEPDTAGEFVEIVVSDTGIGISAEDLPHIFRKFYRVGDVELHSTSKTAFRGGGPGLGLAIAKGIVEAHGGRIWAESAGFDELRCPGSVFRIMLPIHVEQPPSPSERLPGLDRVL